MLTYPQIDPVLVKVGPLAVRWYGLMYLVGFLCGYWIIRRLVRMRQVALDDDGISDLLFYAAIGVVLGGRLGYVLFYNLEFYLQYPRQIIAIWEGGMSFHGGFLGVMVAVVVFCRKRGLQLLLMADIIAAAGTVGLGFGRIGNFINAELWGRVTDLPWAMVFPGGGPLPRHPSQLYEALLEGGVLFMLLLFLHRRQVRPGIPVSMFLLGYGFFRFGVEFVREPDGHLGFLWGGATMGQLLSLPMIAVGAIGLALLLRRKGAA